MCLASDEGGGIDAVEANSTFIHVVGLRAIDGQEMAAGLTKVVWSPRSNISLYGNTAPVTMYQNQGVIMGLGTDWTLSGSMNMLRELQCADYLNREHYGHFLSDRELWLMATGHGAIATHSDDFLGVLRAGLVADIAIFHNPDPTSVSAHRAVLEAHTDDVILVLRGGEALFGDTAVMDAIPGLDSSCEALPEAHYCATPKSACVESEYGSSFAALAGENGSSYPLVACGDPVDEPTCVPSRPGEYDGSTGAADTDGDGISDGDDNCPFVFNPIRPVDGGVQADHDGDGDGDVCDPCPIAPDTTDCPVPNPLDRDGDLIENADDNCRRITIPNSSTSTTTMSAMCATAVRKRQTPATALSGHDLRGEDRPEHRRPGSTRRRRGDGSSRSCVLHAGYVVIRGVRRPRV